MQIIYNGFLQQHIYEYIVDISKEFGYALEVETLPENMAKWVKNNLDTHTIIGENCQGQPSSYETKMYAIVRRDVIDDPLFLFFKTQKEKDKFIEDFEDLIINKEPFQVMMEDK